MSWIISREKYKDLYEKLGLIPNWDKVCDLAFFPNGKYSKIWKKPALEVLKSGLEYYRTNLKMEASNYGTN